jgi:hypothetical protein
MSYFNRTSRSDWNNPANWPKTFRDQLCEFVIRYNDLVKQVEELNKKVKKLEQEKIIFGTNAK